MDKVFVSGDRVLVRGQIPGFEKGDRGMMKSGIVAGMDMHNETGQVFVNVLLDTPIKGVHKSLENKAGPWAFDPEDLKRV